MEGERGTVTILFTDVVSSTELLTEAGDERARDMFQAHHELLREAASTHGGQEVKWLGDGLMVAFSSAADAVRSAIAMQQAARSTSGRRLEIRVGLNTGDALRDESDYFGASVVVAKRLCDAATSGQILCADVVAGVLRGRRGFDFADAGSLDLKGIPAPVSAYEIRYELASPTERLARTPFVGRSAELERLEALWTKATGGSGGVAVLVGEPGIGKSRLTEELGAIVRRRGGLAATGRCVEGDWAPPYIPFAEAIEALVRVASSEELRGDLPPTAQAFTALSLGLRDALPDLPDPEPLSPDEERQRLFDATLRFLVARAARAPLLLVLDDLHWADAGTIALLGYVGRFAHRHPLLVVGAYRDTDIRAGHRLTDTLGQLRRDTTFDRIRLDGLGTTAVGELLSTLAEHDVPPALVDAIAVETGGNPFFIRETLLHLIEEAKIYRGSDGRWTSDLTIAEMSIPEGVREVVGRRVARLGVQAASLLNVAAVFDGPFRFDVVTAVAELSERSALDSLDLALDAQIIRSGGAADTYEFAHALIRHTLYSDLNPSRQVRLHRDVAEALEKTIDERATAAQHGEIANQYRRSAVLPGAERGVDHALVAADHAEATGAHEEALSFLHTALELLPSDDRRRPQTLGRIGISLAWNLRYDEASTAAIKAGRLIAASEGDDAAADYLADAATTISWAATGTPPAREVAREGLRYVGSRRDVTWAQLAEIELVRRDVEEPEDPAYPGLWTDSPERREVFRVLSQARQARIAPELLLMPPIYDSREAVPPKLNLGLELQYRGDFRSTLDLSRQRAAADEALGRIASGAFALTIMARALVALGNLDEARRTLERAREVGERVPGGTVATAFDLAVVDELWSATDDPEPHQLALLGVAADTADPVSDLLPLAQISELRSIGALIMAGAGRAYARLGRTDVARQFLPHLVVPLERLPAWAQSYPRMACNAAEILWLAGTTDHLDVIERSLRDKVVGPDFRYPMHDGRLGLAWLTTLTDRYEEAVTWFAEARRVLAEQDSEPMLAICDFDEARMHLRRGDAAAAVPFLRAARHRFAKIGMTGWLARAAAL